MRVLYALIAVVLITACAPMVPIASPEEPEPSAMAPEEPVQPEEPVEPESPVGQPEQSLTACEPAQRKEAFCTKIYMPVCAEVDTGIRCITEPCPSTEMRTYANVCEACKDAKVLGYVEGECAQQELAAGEECPVGKVRYASQLGFRCVTEYPENTIKAWPQCTKQSQCRGADKCVYAGLTTHGETIIYVRGSTDEFQKGGFKCVPPDYADMLLHGAGMTYLDENGEQGTAIA